MFKPVQELIMSYNLAEHNVLVPDELLKLEMSRELVYAEVTLLAAACVPARRVKRGRQGREK
eukprot:309424-Hanusia_phi.AAC.6